MTYIYIKDQLRVNEPTLCQGKSEWAYIGPRTNKPTSFWVRNEPTYIALG